MSRKPRQSMAGTAPTPDASAFFDTELTRRAALHGEHDIDALYQRLAQLNLRTLHGPALSDAETVEHALLRRLLPLNLFETTDLLMRLRWLTRDPAATPDPELRMIAPGLVAAYAHGECVGYMEGRTDEDGPWYGRVAWEPLSAERRYPRQTLRADHAQHARTVLLQAARILAAQPKPAPKKTVYDE